MLAANAPTLSLNRALVSLDRFVPFTGFPQTPEVQYSRPTPNV